MPCHTYHSKRRVTSSALDPDASCGVWADSRQLVVQHQPPWKKPLCHQSTAEIERNVPVTNSQYVAVEKTTPRKVLKWIGRSGEPEDRLSDSRNGPMREQECFYSMSKQKVTMGRVAQALLLERSGLKKDHQGFT